MSQRGKDIQYNWRLEKAGRREVSKSKSSLFETRSLQESRDPLAALGCYTMLPYLCGAGGENAGNIVRYVTHASLVTMPSLLASSGSLFLSLSLYTLYSLYS